MLRDLPGKNLETATGPPTGGLGGQAHWLRGQLGCAYPTTAPWVPRGRSQIRPFCRVGVCRVAGSFAG